VLVNDQAYGRFRKIETTTGRGGSGGIVCQPTSIFFFLVGNDYPIVAKVDSQ